MCTCFVHNVATTYIHTYFFLKKKHCIFKQRFTRGWVEFEIKTNIMGRSMLPNMYFSGQFKQSGGVITAIDLLGFQISPKLLERALLKYGFLKKLFL